MSDTEDNNKGDGSKKVVIILVAALAVVLVAGGIVIMTLMNSSKTQAGPDPRTVPGAVYAMEDPMTLNLSDGRFLKINMALQMSEVGDAALEEAGEGATPDMTKAQDAAITILSKYTYDDLLKPEGKDKARQELIEEVQERYDGEVLSVLFTEFVMQ